MTTELAAEGPNPQEGKEEDLDHVAPWPPPGEHLWDKWTTNTARQGAKPATQSRRCVHPACSTYEIRDAPNG